MDTEFALDHPLDVLGLVKDYKTARAVDGVSFVVPKGKVFCLLGPNGAGKTTTLEICQGRRHPTRGSVRAFGVDPRKAPPSLRRRIGVLPQHFMGFDELTVRENLEYFAAIYDANPDIPALLERMSLKEEADKRFNKLSGGTRRRVGILAAIVNDPELVFLDEPTAGVDPANRRKLWEIIEGLRREGRSVVLTTHYMDEAERLSDHVAMLWRGRIVAEGSPDAVKSAHGGPVVVRVTGLQEIPDKLAARAGAQADAAAGTLSVPLAHAGEGPGVLADLIHSGVAYREISLREPSLDDAFVRLAQTGGSR